MTAVHLIERARRAGLELIPRGANRLRVRGPDPLPDDLLEDLRVHKLEVLEALEAERAREAAVDDAWRRLQALYLRAGEPRGWLTSPVRHADEELGRLWLAARISTRVDADFRAALARWERLAARAIRSAADGESP